jgi:hypothetical protein
MSHIKMKPFRPNRKILYSSYCSHLVHTESFPGGDWKELLVYQQPAGNCFVPSTMAERINS